jgi:hypothetical protein
MRYFNYSESANLNEALDYLDKCMNEGMIRFDMDELEDIISIENHTIDDEDPFYDRLETKFDLIEDIDYEDFSDDDYDDFYDDDMEDY